MIWQVYKTIKFSKGYNRTLIFDSIKSEINFIPNEFHDYLLNNNYVIFEETVDVDFFDYLKKNDFIFKTNDNIKELFIEPFKKTEIPYHIGIAVIELSFDTAENLYKMLDAEVTDCKIGQFNFIFSGFSNEIKVLRLFAEFLKNCDVDLIELTILEEFDLVEELFYELKSINRIFVVNNFTSSEIIDNHGKFNNRMYSNTDIKSLKISADMITFFESEKHHVYYSNKIFIGKETEIKNTSKNPDIFYYLKNLETFDTDKIKQSENFSKYWNIRKEDTLVCRDCEFKRLCNDNRLPIYISDSLWGHNQECQYNPYISKWLGEEGYLSLEESGVRIENKVILDAHKLTEINKVLWEDN